jgi:hypothetical protein
MNSITRGFPLRKKNEGREEYEREGMELVKVDGRCNGNWEWAYVTCYRYLEQL